MKKSMLLLGLMILCLGTISNTLTIKAYESMEPTSLVPDYQFKKCMTDQLNISPNTELTIAEINKIGEKLDCSNRGITNISGVGYASNLKAINLSYNEILEADELKYNENLEELNISNNKITDFKFLNTLVNLESERVNLGDQVRNIGNKVVNSIFEFGVPTSFQHQFSIKTDNKNTISGMEITLNKSGESEIKLLYNGKNISTVYVNTTKKEVPGCGDNSKYGEIIQPKEVYYGETPVQKYCEYKNEKHSASIFKKLYSNILTKHKINMDTVLTNEESATIFKEEIARVKQENGWNKHETEMSEDSYLEYIEFTKFENEDLNS